MHCAANLQCGWGFLDTGRSQCQALHPGVYAVPPTAKKIGAVHMAASCTSRNWSLTSQSNTLAAGQALSSQLSGTAAPGVPQDPRQSCWGQHASASLTLPRSLCHALECTCRGVPRELMGNVCPACARLCRMCLVSAGDCNLRTKHSV